MVEFTLWDKEGATKIVWHQPKEKKTDACVVVFPGGGYANLVTELFAKHCDIVYDRFTGATYQGRGAVLGYDLKFFIYNSGGNVGSAKVNTNAIHGKSPFYRMNFLVTIIKHFCRFVKPFLKKRGAWLFVSKGFKIRLAKSILQVLGGLEYGFGSRGEKLLCISKAPQGAHRVHTVDRRALGVMLAVAKHQDP